MVQILPFVQRGNPPLNCYNSLTMADKVRFLGEFTNQVREIREDWTLADDKELWFRGEKQDYGDTRLRPVLYRPPKTRNSLKAIPELLKIENSLFATFQRCNSELSDRPIEDDFNGYLLMQHHGGPTRLLDWSDGSLMALHFALRNKQGDNSDPVVYVLDPYRLMDKLDSLPDTPLMEEKWKEYIEAHPEYAEDDVSEAYLPSGDDAEMDFELPRIPLFLRFPLFSRRVAAQRSQFIVFGSDPSWLSGETLRPDPAIRTITIDGKCARKIRAELQECGVTESVIFPDLDGLGRELDQLWQDRQ